MEKNNLCLFKELWINRKDIKEKIKQLKESERYFISEYGNIYKQMENDYFRKINIPIRYLERSSYATAIKKVCQIAQVACTLNYDLLSYKNVLFSPSTQIKEIPYKNS